MGKIKGKVKKGTRPAAALPKQEKPNLFEMMFNKKKFDVLGKKQKGEKRKSGKARSEGLEKRKGTLLVEYKQREKANAFIDRRFEENDETLTADEKAIARFQKQRMKDFGGSKFNLTEDAEPELLTHMGMSLAEAHGDDLVIRGSWSLRLTNRMYILGPRDIEEKGQPGELDDEDELDAQLVNDFHFGGGFVKKAPAEGGQGGEDNRPRSKKEVMEEIMAKSKAFRAEKGQQREADLDATEALDADLAQLMRGGALQGMVKPKGTKHSAASTKDLNAEDAAYDRARRELVFEAKAKVGDKTKPAEQAVEEERLRLEQLEKRRLKRMQGEEIDDDDGAAAVPAGGFAARRAKRRKLEASAGLTGDSLEDDFDLEDGQQQGSDSSEGSHEDSSESEGEAGKRTLDQRRIQRAAGSHPLQASFREASAQLLKKYGVTPARGHEDSEGSGEESESEEGSSGEGSDGESSEEGDGLTADRQDDGVASDVEDIAEEGTDDDNNGDALPGSSRGEHGLADREQPSSNRSQYAGLASVRTAGQELPFIISAPDTYEGFASLVAGRPALELRLAMQRIRTCNSAELSADSRRKLQVLYGILVQHFAIRAASTPVPLAELDSLTQQLLEMTGEVPLYAATVARARLSKLQERLSSVLQDPSSAADSKDGAWAPQRHLLLLKLWATVFPASDRRHSVLTPAALLVAAHIALCPVHSLRHIAQGLYLSSLALHMASPAKRLAPEPLAFALRASWSALPESARPPRYPSIPEWSYRLEPFTGWQAVSPRLDLAAVLEGGQPWNHANGEEESPDVLEAKAGCLLAAIGLLGRAGEISAGVASFPEIFQGPVTALKTLGDISDLPQAVEMERVRVLNELEVGCMAVLGKRRPLTRDAKAKPEVKLFNPRFEDDFATGKDYDPDRDRAEARKLKRLVTKERRGAIRELRKDAAFLGEQAEGEKEAQRAELKGTLRKNTAWLQSMESDFNSGGQGGMWKKKRGRK